MWPHTVKKREKGRESPRERKEFYKKAKWESLWGPTRESQFADNSNCIKKYV